MDSSKKESIFKLLKEGLILKTVLEVTKVSRTEHHRQLSSDNEYKARIKEIRKNRGRIPEEKIERFLTTYTTTQNIEKTLGKLQISLTQYKNERKENFTFLRGLKKVRNLRDKEKKRYFFEKLEEFGGDFISTYRKTRFIPQMVQSWIKKDKDFENKKNEILKKFNKTKKRKLHPYKNEIRAYKTPKDPNAVEILDKASPDYHGAFVILGKVVADTCKSCKKIYLIENFYQKMNSPTKYTRRCIHCISMKIVGRLRNRIGHLDYETGFENFKLNVNGNIIGYRCDECQGYKKKTQFVNGDPSERICITCSIKKP